VRTTKAGQSALLLLDVAEILREENVSYAVIGAFALSILGEVRASTDVDALLHVTVDRMTQLQARFEHAGFATDLQRGDAEDPIPSLLVLTDTHGNQVDLLSSLRGLDPQIFARTLEALFRGEPLRFVGREDFIAMKCFAGGPQDLLDAESAYRRAQTPVNLDLVRVLARRFGRYAADNLETVLASIAARP
jgi:hypothetical protein